MIRIVEGPIDRNAVIEGASSSEAGAIVTFDGVVRNHARGKKVTHLYYEAYPEMAEKEMEKIRAETLRRWSLEGMAMAHRTGRLEIGDSSVFIAISSAHRAEAFEACRFAIDSLKTTVPIWKKEHYEDGEIWIEGYGA
jgi:molybdopterin synthase catalytic subunit